MSEEDFECPDCGGSGKVQCVNLGSKHRNDVLPCPTCIAYENEVERKAKADTITALRARVRELEEALERYRDELRQFGYEDSTLDAIAALENTDGR